MAFQCLVHNFLAAKDVRFTVRGFTILKGESSSGKSSSLKAIYAACTNTFSPSQVRWKEDAATIKLRFNPEEPILTVVRSRKGSPVMNFNGKEYSKISRTVPKEIEEYLNIGFIQVGSDKYCLNFFTQFQPPLLHVFSQRRIAEILSSSAALDDYNLVVKAFLARREQLKGSFNSIDTLMTEIKSRIHPMEVRLQLLQPLQAKLTEEYKGYLALETSVDQIKGLVRQFIYFSRKSLLIQQRRRLKDTYGELLEFATSVETLEDVRDKYFKHRYVQKRLNLNRQLSSLYSDYQSLSESADSLSSLSQAIITVASKKSNIEPLRLKVNLYRSAEDGYDELNKIQQFIYNITELKGFIVRVKELNERIDFSKKLVGLDTCPFCGSTIHSDMNKAEIVAKRKALEAQILADEKDISVLESKISEGCANLGINPDLESINKSLEEKVQLLNDKESEIDSILSEIEKLEYAPVQEQDSGVDTNTIPANPAVKATVVSTQPQVTHAQLQETYTQTDELE